MENKARAIGLKQEGFLKEEPSLEQQLWLFNSLKSVSFESENAIDLINGKFVLISQDCEREAILALKPKPILQETFLEGSNGMRFYVKCNYDGTTNLGQMALL